MNVNTAPTKGNLMSVKNFLQLAQTGYDLLEKKRNILVREMMLLIDKANDIQNRIDDTFMHAHKNLQKANIKGGVCLEIADAAPIENDVHIKYRSVMGVEIPILSIDEPKDFRIPFGLNTSDESLDEAFIGFQKAKRLSVEIAEVENSVYRLAYAIKKTQKRANALKNIIIPTYQELLITISTALDEKEREEFSRMKMIKKQKM